jgi:hypothetical protein
MIGAPKADLDKPILRPWPFRHIVLYIRFDGLSPHLHM